MLAVLIAGIVLFALDRVGWAAVVGGFVPLRVSDDAAFRALVPDALPVALTPLSATLVHGGLLHLGFNLLMFAIVGPATEQALGKRGVIALYLAGAFAAVAAQCVVDPASPVPMIGVSGALSAIVGAYSMLYGQSRARAIGPIPARVVHVLWLAAGWTVLNFAMGVFGAAAGASIAVAAHIGGFLAGLALLGPLLTWRWKGTASSRS